MMPLWLSLSARKERRSREKEGDWTSREGRMEIPEPSPLGAAASSPPPSKYGRHSPTHCTAAVSSWDRQRVEIRAPKALR